MTTTMLIAQLLLPVFALVALSALMNPKWFKGIAKEIAASPALTYIVSFMNIIGGTAIILYHNVWSADLSVVITVIGWLAAIKGTVYLLFPKSIDAVAGMVSRKSIVYTAAILCLALSVIMFLLSGVR